MALKALIFDVDGTLAETEEAHRQAFNATFAAHGLDWHWNQQDYARLLKVTGGKERMAAHRAAVGHGPDDATIAAMHKEKTAAYGDILARGGLQARPGVLRLIEEARAAGLLLAIATTTSPGNVEALAACLWGKPAGQVFDVIAAGDVVKAKKPAPDIYLFALEHLALPAAQALAFEDTWNGLHSAKGAGLKVVATPSVYSAGEDFAAAHRVLPDLGCFRLVDALALA
ncbi:HAD-IA family hydrolase [Rhodobacter sp. Har01]|uniref:HAD-IA family hydrolase n=1 Tax=Rhodobacter sp. Har01 TaxID=2883999 RepID=UPI001D095C6F|nr:HAD-IA family hydrolase [Rhodobacter sp. Har01]MCB6177798.1 HAD-IA family hydrolase [Rhodobacter sp. Har01]